MISCGFTSSKLDTRGFRYLPDCYLAHAADLRSDRGRVRINLERTDDLGALLRRNPFSRFCRGERDARSFGDFADLRMAHATNLLSDRCRVRVVLERGDNLRVLL